MVDMSAPKGGIDMNDLSFRPADHSKKHVASNTRSGLTSQEMYVRSKVGNWFMGNEMARRVGKKGIISVTQSPGNLRTNVTRHVPWMKYVFYPLLYHAKMGAYTELWAGLSPELNTETHGCYVIPWGRIHPSPRRDLLDALKSVEEGGTGRAKEFWEWCQNVTNEYR
jgi:NAD(P)-dependent dehydrogenase (short-subunit alcohol dehydrogenase family)